MLILLQKQLWKQVVLYTKGEGAQMMRAIEHQTLDFFTIEVKDHMPSVGYVKLASILVCSQDLEHVAPHLFLLLHWNMVPRVENAVNSHIDLFGFL